jgi:hypothetical protein
LTLVLTIVFLLRSVFIFLDFLVFKSTTYNVTSKLVNQIFFELFPATLIMYVLGKKIPTNYDEYLYNGQQNSKETQPIYTPRAYYHTEESQDNHDQSIQN